MDRDTFERKIVKRIANLAIGPSTLRNQGKSGLNEISRNFFQEINLNDFFASLDNKNYQTFLDSHTEILENKFNIDNWGAPRKALNIFFRDIVYNRYITDIYKLPSNIEDFENLITPLEVPLDSYVAKGITKSLGEKKKWTTIKDLTKKVSDEFQQMALIDSNKRGIIRVNLDLVYWREK